MKTPVSILVDNIWCSIVDADGRVVVPPITNFEKDARRIMLCLNHCAELSDEQLIIERLRKK